MHSNAIVEAVLVVDIGNTNIVCGIYEHEKMSWFARFQSSRKRLQMNTIVC